MLQFRKLLREIQAWSEDVSGHRTYTDWNFALVCQKQKTVRFLLQTACYPTFSLDNDTISSYQSLK